MDFISFLGQRLAAPLPGIHAHREFVPDLPDAAIRLREAPPTARKSAVLVPLILGHGPLPEVLLEVRSESMRNHRGQISFPGGRLDDGEDAERAALRELEEEVGIPASDVIVLGRLTPVFIPPSNSAVVPIVGVVRQADDLVLSIAEVKETFRLGLQRILPPEARTVERWNLNGNSVDVPFWPVHTTPLWGATAMILNELVWMTREYAQP
jgi:8-oxo-dGTP pyrophosphatase MutT (NUDIX family)